MLNGFRDFASGLLVAALFAGLASGCLQQPARPASGPSDVASTDAATAEALVAQDAAQPDELADIPGVATCTIAPDCDDKNDCTVESCSAASTCLHTGRAGPCDDGNACTTGGYCEYAHCQHGTPVTCPNPEPDCAIAACDPKKGCTLTPWPDDSPCGTPDACFDHACAAGQCTAVASSPCYGPVWPHSLHITKPIALTLPDPTQGQGCAVGSPLTAAAWVRPSKQGVALVVAAAGGVALWVKVTSGTISVGLASGAATGPLAPLHTAPWPPGSWTHIAVGVDSQGLARGYIDGQPGSQVKLAGAVKPGAVHVANLPTGSSLPLAPYLGDLTQVYWGCTAKLRGVFSPALYPDQDAQGWQGPGVVLASGISEPKGADWIPDGPFASATSFQVDCRVGTCSPVGGACTFTPAADGSRCWDGDPCHTGSCTAGKCQMASINCSDGDPTTTDQCRRGACVHFVPAVGCAGDPTAAACQACAQLGTQGWSCDTCKQAEKLGAACQTSVPSDAAVVPGGSLQMGCDAESQAEPVPSADAKKWCDLCKAPTSSADLPDWFDYASVLKGYACALCSPGACTVLEKPPAQVVVAPSLLVKKHEVTRAEWLQLEPTDPSEAPTCASCPVTHVSLYDAMHYANLRSTSDAAIPCYDLTQCSGTVGLDFTCTATSAASHCGWRLPSEAEWEHLARGTATGENTGPLAEVAWFEDNGQGEVRPVGLKKPNSYGLFDVQGNVWEWTIGPVAALGSIYDPPTQAAWPLVPTAGPWCWPAVALGGPWATNGSLSCGWSSCSEPCPAVSTTSLDAILRGCSASDSRLTCRLSYRYLTAPNHRSAYAGLRLVRTIADM